MQRLQKTAPLVLLGFFIFFAACGDDEEPSTPTPTGITSAAFPNNAANLTAGGGPVSGRMTGGTAPYTINTQPDAAVATATISGASMDTLTITPVGVGTTSVVVEDASGDSPAGRTVTIAINVTGGSGGTGVFAGSGSFSVNTSIGNFGAEGVYDSNATSGQGVGALRYTSPGDDPADSDVLDIIAYNARSVSDVDLAFISFYYPNGTLTTGSYQFVQGTPGYAFFGIGFGIDLNNPMDIYAAISGTANLASLTSSTASGTFSGTGLDPQNPGVPITFSEGAFNVTGYGTGDAPNKSIEQLILRAVREARSKAR
jgi:hypothetical protein